MDRSRDAYIDDATRQAGCGLFVQLVHKDERSECPATWKLLPQAQELARRATACVQPLTFLRVFRILPAGHGQSRTHGRGVQDALSPRGGHFSRLLPLFSLISRDESRRCDFHLTASRTRRQAAIGARTSAASPVGEGDQLLLRKSQGIAGAESSAIDFEDAAHEMDIGLALRVERQLRTLPAVEQASIKPRVGIDRERIVSAVRGKRSGAKRLVFG